MVKYIVYKKVREIPARCEVEDFISCGLEALIHSIERYDPEKGATLEQFAWTRIHGAVLDELRRQDWAPRSLRRWERDINQAREQFIGVHGRQPTRDELARRDRHDASRSCASARTRSSPPTSPRSTRSCSATTRRRSSASTRSSARTASPTPSTTPPRDQAKLRFRAAFERLPQREREVAVLLYVKNLTLREIGDILGVSESRVCQIHGQLKKLLREQLDADALLFSEVRVGRAASSSSRSHASDRAPPRARSAGEAVGAQRRVGALRRPRRVLSHRRPPARVARRRRPRRAARAAARERGPQRARPLPRRGERRSVGERGAHVHQLVVERDAQLDGADRRRPRSAP